VFDINNRGSSGYGKTFYHLDDKKHGEADLKDVVAARHWLAGQDWISDKVAVMGGSYGGYMTAAAMAFHPEVFDAGVNIFGVTNWTRTLESIPAWWTAQKIALYDEMGDPAADAERPPAHLALVPRGQDQAAAAGGPGRQRPARAAGRKRRAGRGGEAQQRAGRISALPR
jgi:dipeptidyl aminopeptidase/acylaminoacyl peptidase